jgi:hypothetical protein
MSNFLIRAATLFTVTIRDPREHGSRALLKYQNMQDFGITDTGIRVFASRTSLVAYHQATSLVLGRAAPHQVSVDQRLVARNIISGRITRFWDNPDPLLAVYNDGRCKVVSFEV